MHSLQLGKIAKVFEDKMMAVTGFCLSKPHRNHWIAVPELFAVYPNLLVHDDLADKTLEKIS